MKDFLSYLLDILVPKFIEERVAVIDLGQGNFEILCCEDDLTPDDHFDFMATSRCFAWLGFGFFAKVTFDDEG